MTRVHEYQGCHELVRLAQEYFFDLCGQEVVTERFVFLCCAIWHNPWEEQSVGAANERTLLEVWKNTVNTTADLTANVYQCGADWDNPVDVDCVSRLEHFVLELRAGHIPRERLFRVKQDAEQVNDTPTKRRSERIAPKRPRRWQ